MSIDFNKEFRKADPCQNRGYHNAKAHPKCDEFIIKMAPLKLELILIMRICDLIYSFSLVIHLFSTTVLFSTDHI